MPDAVEQLADVRAIQDLIYAYCRAVDRLDVPLGHSIWHEDGWADYGAAYYQGPGRGVIDHICAQHRALSSHSHQVSNILVDLRGPQAGSESYVQGTLRLEREGKTMQIGVWARYIDLWEKREGRWGLVRRTMAMDHSEMREVTPMPTQGAAPSRDRADPSYAVLTGGQWIGR